MEIKKRILSAAILLSVLATGLVYTSKHPYYPENIGMENGVDDERIKDLIGENAYLANPYYAYNEALEAVNKKLDMEDIAYLSSLRENQAMVAVNNTVEHYNVVSLDGDDTLVINVGGKPRVADKTSFGDYYYDLLTGCYASDILTDEDLENSMPLGEFVNKFALTPDGYCFPNLGPDKIEATEEALKTIEEIYGKEVAEVVREKGLPLPFYSYQAIYVSCDYKNYPIKGLNN